MNKAVSIVFAGLLLATSVARADDLVQTEDLTPTESLANYYRRTVLLVETPTVDPSLLQRLVKYTQIALKHRVNGLASYYSSFFDGRKTANGEIFRNRKYSAAHLTLPLGTWVEVKARATGRKLRLRVNDRGPYAKKFCLDLSQAAARFLGVDVARDRHVDVRIIALPGEEPLAEDLDVEALETAASSHAAAIQTINDAQ